MISAYDFIDIISNIAFQLKQDNLLLLYLHSVVIDMQTKEGLLVIEEEQRKEERRLLQAEEEYARMIIQQQCENKSEEEIIQLLLVRKLVILTSGVNCRNKRVN